MPLIVEDGTLLAGANSFASVADADAYHAARLTAAWTDELAEVQKEAALIRASDWLNRKVMWNGRKASPLAAHGVAPVGRGHAGRGNSLDEIPGGKSSRLAANWRASSSNRTTSRRSTGGGDIASLSVDVDQHRLQRHGPRRKQYSSPVRPARRARHSQHGRGGGIMEVGRG